MSDRLGRALASGDAGGVEFCAAEISLRLARRSTIPPAAFRCLLNVLERRELLHLEEGAWHLPAVFSMNWEAFSESQKDALLEALGRAYPQFRDWMACFTISEILGRYYGGERAYKVLNRLMQVSEETPRAFVPHGFEHIARESPDPELAARAFARILEMEEDASERVREEVDESLARLWGLHALPEVTRNRIVRKYGHPDSG